MTSRFALPLLLATGLLALGDDAKPAGIRTISSSGTTSAGMGENSYGVSSASLMSWDGLDGLCTQRMKRDDRLQSIEKLGAKVGHRLVAVTRLRLFVEAEGRLFVGPQVRGHHNQDAAVTRSLTP